MKGYFRTQWFNLIAGALNLGLFVYDWATGYYDMAIPLAGGCCSLVDNDESRLQL